MKSLRHILFGLVIGSLLVLAMGASYDKTYFQHDPYYLDGYGIYFGTDGDSYMEWDNTNGELDWVITAGSINITLTAQKDNMAGLYVNCTVPTGQQSWGGIYSDMTIAGTTDGATTAVAGIVWCDSSSAPTVLLSGAKFGINETGADMDSVTVAGIIVENLLSASGTNPAWHYMMYFNCTQAGETPDAWINAVNNEAIAFTPGADTNATKTGDIKVRISGTYHYIRTWDGIS